MAQPQIWMTIDHLISAEVITVEGDRLLRLARETSRPFLGHSGRRRKFWNRDFL